MFNISKKTFLLGVLALFATLSLVLSVQLQPGKIDTSYFISTETKLQQKYDFSFVQKKDDPIIAIQFTTAKDDEEIVFATESETAELVSTGKKLIKLNTKFEEGKTEINMQFTLIVKPADEEKAKEQKVREHFDVLIVSKTAKINLPINHVVENSVYSENHAITFNIENGSYKACDVEFQLLSTSYESVVYKLGKETKTITEIPSNNALLIPFTSEKGIPSEITVNKKKDASENQKMYSIIQCYTNEGKYTDISLNHDDDGDRSIKVYNLAAGQTFNFKIDIDPVEDLEKEKLYDNLYITQKIWFKFKDNSKYSEDDIQVFTELIKTDKISEYKFPVTKSEFKYYDRQVDFTPNEKSNLSLVLSINLKSSVIVNYPYMRLVIAPRIKRVETGLTEFFNKEKISIGKRCLKSYCTELGNENVSKYLSTSSLFSLQGSPDKETSLQIYFNKAPSFSQFQYTDSRTGMKFYSNHVYQRKFNDYELLNNERICFAFKSDYYDTPFPKNESGKVTDFNIKIENDDSQIFTIPQQQNFSLNNIIAPNKSSIIAINTGSFLKTSDDAASYLAWLDNSEENLLKSDIISSNDYLTEIKSMNVNDLKTKYDIITNNSSYTKDSAIFYEIPNSSDNTVYTEFHFREIINKVETYSIQDEIAIRLNKDNKEIKVKFNSKGPFGIEFTQINGVENIHFNYKQNETKTHDVSLKVNTRNSVLVEDRDDTKESVEENMTFTLQGENSTEAIIVFRTYSTYFADSFHKNKVIKVDKNTTKTHTWKGTESNSIDFYIELSSVEDLKKEMNRINVSTLEDSLTHISYK